jgi:GNAT superfamily N-acetyltransferase
MMSEFIKIQEITPNYVPQISPKDWRPDAYHIAFQALNVAGCRRLVAIIGKEEVGLAAFRKADDALELVSLASKYSGRGIGSRLLHAVKTIGPVWAVADRNAESFYEKMGFAHIGYKGAKKIYSDDPPPEAA